jgi:hypothetical protein
LRTQDRTQHARSTVDGPHGAATRPGRPNNVAPFPVAPIAVPTTRGLKQLEIVAHLSDGNPGHPRGLYVCDVRTADLPYVLARLPMRDAAGAVREWRYLIAATPDSAGTVITEAELGRGTMWPVLGLDVPGDSTVIEAITYTVHRMARALPVTELVPRWVAGRLHMPPAEVLESAGYMVTTGSEEEARTNWGEIAAIAAGDLCENLALNLGFAAAGPYLAALSTVEAQSVCVANIGEERRGKTTNAYAAAAWYGAPTVIDPVLSESAIAIGDSLAELGVLPFFRDEVHAANWSQPDWHMYFMRTLNGAGRRRSSSDGSGAVRRSRQWWGVQFLTGNVDPRFGEVGGITARVLVLAGPHLPNADTSRRVKQLISLSHGWPFKWWLANHESPSEFAEKKKRALKDLWEITGPQMYSAETISEALAFSIAGAEVLESMLGVSGVRENAIRGAVRVVDALAGTLADSPTGFGQRLMRDVTEQMQAHPALWPLRREYELMRSANPPRDQWNPDGLPQRLSDVQGFRWEHDRYGAVASVLPGALKAMTNGESYPVAEALRDLRESGVLVTGGDRRGVQHGVKIAGRMERFYTFRLDVDLDPSEAKSAPEGVSGVGNDTGNDTGNDMPNSSDLHGNDSNDGNDTFRNTPPRGKVEDGDQPGFRWRAAVAPEAAPEPVPVVAEGDDHPGCERCGGYLPVAYRVGRGGTCIRPACRVGGPETTQGALSAPEAAGRVEGQSVASGATQGPQKAGGGHRGRMESQAAQAWEEARRVVAEAVVTDGAIGQEGIPRLLDILTGPCAPRRRIKGDDGRTRMQAPYWSPELPPVIDLVFTASGYSWRRDFAGPTVCFDRSGAWVSAASTVKIAHGALMHTGEMAVGSDPLPAGLFLVRNHRWEEEDVMPSPLMGAQHETEWVAEPTAALLKDLAEAGRWGGSRELEILDSYTAEPVKLNQSGWATGINELRAWAMDTFGREIDGQESPQYTAVKRGMSQAFSTMIGTPVPGAARRFKTKAGRPDIPQAVQAHSTATLWRRGDAVRQLAGDGLGPVALRNVDELVIPEVAVSAVTGAAQDRGKIKALRIDQTGRTLGTFKVKPGKDDQNS